MNEIVLKDDDLPEYLSTTLNEFISPLKIAYFTAADENLNFKCIFSNTPLYKKGARYSVYSLTPILRVLLTKGTILEDELIEKIFAKHNNQMSYILDWSEIKKALIFDVEDLDYFEDQTLVKELIKNRESFLQELDRIIYE